ncbi:MAG: class IV adenylate cyclase [Patescibacteria group bacterium]|nr:class IV adenylate cyclase [Patescibacteria group bacterium]
MAAEIEAKFLNIDHDVLRLKLQEVGAELKQPMRLMRRTLYDFPDKRLHKANGGRLRIRDEGTKITFTYKAGGDGEYAEEHETVVSSYEDTAQIVEAIGMVPFTTQHTKRETWHLNDAEVVLDIWPWLNPYIEIEGATEAAIQDCARTLGLSWDDAFFGSADTAYRQQYPGMSLADTIGSVEELRFEGPMPEWLVERQ